MAAIPTRWRPALLATVIGLGMIWLAGAPFEVPAGPPQAALLAPVGDQNEFPHRFEWSHVPGATEYEVSVGRGGELVFRQRGPSNVLEVEVEPGQGPGPGDYVWEVVAWRGDEPVGRSAGAFRVITP